MDKPGVYGSSRFSSKRYFVKKMSATELTNFKRSHRPRDLSLLKKSLTAGGNDAPRIIKHRHVRPLAPLLSASSMWHALRDRLVWMCTSEIWCRRSMMRNLMTFKCSSRHTLRCEHPSKVTLGRAPPNYIINDSDREDIIVVFLFLWFLFLPQRFILSSLLLLSILLQYSEFHRLLLY